MASFNPFLQNDNTLQQQKQQQLSDIANARLTLAASTDITALRAEEFVTPPHFPNPLYVPPPIVPPHLRRSKSRFSDSKFCNPAVPAYVPPELVTFGEGRVLELFLQRARIEDISRIVNTNPSMYFQRKDGELPEDFVGNPGTELREQLQTREKDFANEKQKAEAVDFGTSDDHRKLVGKVYFSEEQMQSGVFGAIFGFRGSTQRMLQETLKVKIIVGGRGITDPRKVRPEIMSREEAQQLAQEPPHCRITAPTELLLKQAVQKIEFFVSNDPAAVREREELARRGEIENGVKYRGNRYQRANAVREAAMNAARAAGRVQGLASTGHDAADDEVHSLMKELGE